MLKKLNRWAAPPKITNDHEKSRAATLLNIVLWMFISVAGAYGIFAPIDPRFKGYGTCLTDAEGVYSFRTIRPVAYTGRAPHIHFALAGKAVPRFVTQMYVDGAAEIGRDFLLRSLSAAERKALVVTLEKSSAQAWRGKFDIVVERRT